MKNSLQLWQAKNGLLDDGIIGKKTLSKMMEVWNLSKSDISHFAGQTAHESQNFKRDEENLKYSSKRLLEVFPKYFTRLEANVAAYNPELIANRVYGNRMGNTKEGDGYKYRGRGPLMLTGKRNYELFAESVQNPNIVECPDLVISDYYFESALFFFNENKLWELTKQVNRQSINQLTRRINGGYNGLRDRIYLTERFYSLL